MGREDKKEGHSRQWTRGVGVVRGGRVRKQRRSLSPPPKGAVDDRSLLSVAPSSLLSTLLSSVMLSPLLSTSSSSIKPSPSCQQDHPPPFSSPCTPGYPLNGNGGNINHPAVIAKKTFTQAYARSNLRPTMAHSSWGGRGGVTDDVKNGNNNKKS